MLTPERLFPNTPKLSAEIKDLMVREIQPVAITVDDIPHSLTYAKGAEALKPSVHIGQRKLFDNEVQFLTTIRKNSDGPFNVVYAGAAPSNKHQLLCDLFPAVKWLPVDPNPFRIHDHTKSHRSPDYKLAMDRG